MSQVHSINEQKKKKYSIVFQRAKIFKLFTFLWLGTVGGADDFFKVL